jgi:hypothetical protein
MIISNDTNRNDDRLLCRGFKSVFLVKADFFHISFSGFNWSAQCAYATLVVGDFLSFILNFSIELIIVDVDSVRKLLYLLEKMVSIVLKGSSNLNLHESMKRNFFEEKMFSLEISFLEKRAQDDGESFIPKNLFLYYVIMFFIAWKTPFNASVSVH